MERDYQAELNTAMDSVLGLLEAAAAADVSLDPLATLLDRVRARGDEIDLENAPPILRMLLSGMG